MFIKVRISPLRPDMITKKELQGHFKHIRLFTNLPVIENVLVGQHLRLKSSWIQALANTRSYKNEEKK